MEPNQTYRLLYNKGNHKTKTHPTDWGKIVANDQCLIWRRQWQPTPVLSPGKSHGWRSLVGCSPWGRKESDTTERFQFHFSLSCIGERNGNPLQRSCLENPRDGGVWCAAIYEVARSWTRLKRLSCSSSSRDICYSGFSCRLFLISAVPTLPFNISPET